MSRVVTDPGNFGCLSLLCYVALCLFAVERLLLQIHFMSVYSELEL